MFDIPLYPLLYTLLLGIAGGFLVGFAIRKLSGLIALLFGVLIFAVNLMGLIRLLGIDLGIPSLQNLINTLFGFLPVSQPDLYKQFGGLLPVVSQIPFIGGFVFGIIVSFRFT